MSVGAILTIGYGSFASVHHIPTLGYLPAAEEPAILIYGGAGHPEWRKRRKRLSELVDKAIDEIYAELTAPSVAPEVREQAVAAVQQHAKQSERRKAVPRRIDWDAARRDAETVIELRALWAEYILLRRKRQLDEDDEDFFLLASD